MGKRYFISEKETKMKYKVGNLVRIATPYHNGQLAKVIRVGGDSFYRL